MNRLEYSNKNEQLPDYYNEDVITLLPRDPYWVFAYWEISHSTKKSIEQSQGKSWSQITKLFNLHRFNPTGKKIEGTSRVHIGATGELKGNWYFQVGVPDRKYYVELGYLDGNDTFHNILQSNQVQTPRDSLSDIIDEKWRLPNWRARSLFWRTPLLSLNYSDNSNITGKIPSFKITFKRKRILRKEG
ncbi:MAG: DUF4912 domain-containing protein [Firmicutes bacterium]|nr:DUF4912 domain-containing protein [Bacillota bacterium]